MQIINVMNNSSVSQGPEYYLFFIVFSDHGQKSGEPRFNYFLRLVFKFIHI